MKPSIYWRRVGVCVLLNLLSEFWVHGLTGFMNPVLTGSLIVLYTTYFLMVEDLIVRFKLRDYHVMMTAFIFGLWHETFTTESVFGDAVIFGVNPIIILLSTIFWWGAMQTVAFLYFANRIVGSRDWEHRRLGRIGWIMCMFFSLQAAQNYMKNPSASHEAYLVVFCLLAVVGFSLIKSVKKEGSHSSGDSKALDILVLVHIVVSLIVGFTIGSASNSVSLIGFVVWSVVFGFVVGVVRYKLGRPIQI